MKHSIRYVNGKGDEIDFTGPLPYRMVTGNLFDYAWSYNSADDYRLRGAKITAFKRALTEYSVELDVFAATESVYLAAVNALHDIADYDVVQRKPGKLYVDGSYISCYITASKKESWERPTCYLEVTLTLLVEYPIWWTEQTYQFSKVEVQSDPAPDEFLCADGSAGTGEFLFEFVHNISTSRTVDNSFSYKDTDFILRVYGPATNPSISIGGVAHSVDVTVHANEVLEVNSYERTCIKRSTINGVETNVFGSRGETVFEPVPASYVSVAWSGEFAFDLVLLTGRSEPLWTS